MIDKVTEVIIPTDADGQRLDNFLIKIVKGVPKSRIYKAIRRGEVRIDGGRCKPTARLHAGAKLRIPPFRQSEAMQSDKPPPKALLASLRERILYEDEAFLVLNKPSGLASQGGTGVGYAVLDCLTAMDPNKYAHCALAHRLDMATSGCLVVAKNRQICGELQRLWQANGVQKVYWAVVAGAWHGPARMVDMPLARRDNSQGKKVVVDQEGKPAKTQFTPIAQFAQATIVEVALLTGRMHQIRVHASQIGHPLWGDDKYGDFALNRDLAKQGLKRLCLHAWNITFNHPVSGKKMTITAPIDPYLEELVHKLGN